jgi:hypothetical protein
MVFLLKREFVISGDYTCATTSSRLEITQDKLLFNTHSGY